MSDTMPAVERYLLDFIHTKGAGREHLAYPIGRDRNPIGFPGSWKPLLSPAGQIGNDGFLSESYFGFHKDYPTPGSAAFAE